MFAVKGEFDEPPETSGDAISKLQAYFETAPCLFRPVLSALLR